MPPERKDYRWGVLKHRQMGASHERQGLRNQDAVHVFRPPDESAVVLAVADGHGSPKSFRSHEGSRLAVEAAVEVCREFFEEIGNATPPHPQLKGQAEQHIPTQIFENWKRRVFDHLDDSPFTDEERAAVAEEPLVAYGSTLLVALLTNEYLLCFQLGDGEILAVSDVSETAERVVPKDPALIANETTSLCQDTAPREMRCQFRMFHGSPPALVLLTTDGYPNSFVSPHAFLKVGQDYLNMIRTEGHDVVDNGLPGWLEEASREGSGDDITVGIIYRRDLDKGAEPMPEEEGGSQPAQASDPTPSEPQALTALGTTEEQPGRQSRGNWWRFLLPRTAPRGGRTP